MLLAFVEAQKYATKTRETLKCDKKNSVEL